MAKEKRGKKSRLFWWLLIGGGAVGAAYAVSRKQRPGPCAPPGDVHDRVLVKDEEDLSGLGNLLKALVVQMLENPGKAELLDTMDLVLAIEPVEQPETAVTMTFSDGYVIFEPGVAPGADIRIVCDLDVLMQMSQMGYGVDALKFLFKTPEGKSLIGKVRSGDLKIKGLATHPVGMMKFSRFLAP